MYHHREVFLETPLALVAAEIRFTDSARLRQQSILDHIIIALEDRFPYSRPVQSMGLQLLVGTAPAAQTMPPATSLILTNQSSTESVSLTSTSLTYETTHYTEFPDLLAAVQMACVALASAGVQPAMERIGLRYIDEIRVPEPISDARQWSEWIDNRLIDHLAVGPKIYPVAMTRESLPMIWATGRG